MIRDCQVTDAFRLQWLSYFVNPDTPSYIEALAIEHGYMRLAFFLPFV